jgi:PAS domain S-box-containing protein
MRDQSQCDDFPGRIISGPEWRQMVNSALETAIISTDSEGRVTSWNEGARHMLGWTEHEMVGMTFERIFTPEDQARGHLQLEIDRARALGRGGGEEGWRVCKDGSRIWTAGELNAIRGDSGAIVGYVKILRKLNVTLEQQVLERTEALRHSQKMEAIGRLTGGVAHDFNNLLQIIIGNLEALRRHLHKDTNKAQGAADMAMSGARRAAALTQKLLEFARRQPLSPRPIHVNQLVLGMSEILHRMLGETISVEVIQGEGVWQIEADPNELESAILNLAVNARDAMPNGGSLTIETSNAHLDAAYAARHPELSPGQYVLIAISDTGAGMEAQTVTHAFEPFFTTKPIGKGTGLGLSQVYGFVKQSGGHVTIYSEVGHGTTVNVYLARLLGEGLPSGESAPDTSLPRAQPGETILIVEDDSGVKAATVNSLLELGYAVVDAHDGPSAIDLLHRHVKFDLLLTDVGLPNGLTGEQLAAQVRSLLPHVKVLYTTGYARNAIVHQGRLDPGVHLLTKPFTYSQLARKLRDVFDGSTAA